MGGPFLFEGEVMDREYPRVVPDIPPEAWPYKGTREQMQAALDHFKMVAKDFPKNSREWRSAHMHLNRLYQRKVRVRRPLSKLRADEEHRQRMIIERGKEKVAQAEKAIEGLYDLAAQ